MEYKEMLALEDAVDAFLRKYNRKQEIKIYYYILKGRKMGLDFSFMGYETNTRGLHGIHYKKFTRQYYFGTRQEADNTGIWAMNESQILKIPSILKAAFLEVATTKRKMRIENPKRKELI